MCSGNTFSSQFRALEIQEGVRGWHTEGRGAVSPEGGKKKGVRRDGDTKRSSDACLPQQTLAPTKPLLPRLHLTTPTPSLIMNHALSAPPPSFTALEGWVSNTVQL